MAPLANVPSRVTELAAVQRGSLIIVQFSVPRLTTEGVAIKKPLKLDLRIGTAGAPFNEVAWAAGATHVGEGPVENGLARYEIPSAEWTGKEAVICARVIGSNGKESGWSNYIVLPVVPPPEKPGNVRADATAAGVRVSWAASGNRFRVYRRTAANPAFAPVATVTQQEWTDPATDYGVEYTYIVQGLVDLGNNREAESDQSAPYAITPVDQFPPAAPAGLRASAAPNSIEVAWDRNTEPDLAGYRLYRAAPGADFEKIADSQVPAYSDHNVEPGKSYRYAVSAIDNAGNESPRSAAVDAGLQ
jgi:hypothetical protein